MTDRKKFREGHGHGAEMPSSSDSTYARPLMAHPKADYTKSTVKIINKKIRKPFKVSRLLFTPGWDVMGEKLKIMSGKGG